MKKSLDILVTYLTCEDPVIKNKWRDILDSFYHKDGGHLVKEHTVLGNGDISITLSNDETITIEKYMLPNTMPLTFIEGLVAALNSKVDKVTGKQLSDENFTLLLKQKLDALQNYVHPDTHSISEVQGLQGALDGKVDKVAGKQLTDENFTTQEKTKLNGLENYNPPASQPKSYIQGLEDDLTQINQNIVGKVDKVDGKELSSNDYTDDDKNKLNGLNPLAFKTISDGNGNNIVAEAQDDELTIVGATIDAGTKKVTIKSLSNKEKDTLKILSQNTMTNEGGYSFNITHYYDKTTATLSINSNELFVTVEAYEGKDYFLVREGVGSPYPIFNILYNSEKAALFSTANQTLDLKRSTTQLKSGFITFEVTNRLNNFSPNIDTTYNKPTHVVMIKPLAGIKVLDYNGAEKFNSEQIQFDENFIYNSSNKEVQLNSQYLQLKTGAFFQSFYSGVQATKVTASGESTNTLSQYSVGKLFFNPATSGDSNLFFHLKNNFTVNFGLSTSGGTVLPESINLKGYLVPKNCALHWYTASDKILLFEQDFGGSGLNKTFLLDTIITGRRSSRIGDLTSNYIKLSSKKHDANGNVIGSTADANYQVRTTDTVPQAMLLEDCEFYFMYKVSVNFADATNVNGENKNFMAVVSSLFLNVEIIK